MKIGYFSTCNQVTYGKNKSGKKIYKVCVLNNKINESLFYLIPYRGNIEGQIIILFKCINDKEGSILDVIGKMNDDNLIITLKYIHNIFYKQLYFKELIINQLENSINRKFIDKEIFSIDSNFTEDIDDALSFEEYDEYYLIGVYIAQPIYYLNQTLIETHAKKAFSTLYNNNFCKNNNLWGDTLTEAISLYPNTIRPTFAIFYYINKNYELIKIEHFPATIINKIKTTYDECLQYNNINKLYILTQQLTDINNTHDLVSYWMIKTNNYIGNNYKLPNRVITIDDDIDNNELKMIFIKKGAFYSLSENYHQILDKYNYIHFTSPIRRIIDTINHWCITYDIPFSDMNINLDEINKIDKATKKYHNDIKLIEAINNLADENELDGWIYKNNWKDFEKNTITVYFKELGFQKVELWQKKFNNLLNDELINKFNNLKIGNMFKFKVYKKIGFLPRNKILIKIIF